VSAFRFEAVDAQGRLRQGLVDAADARAVRDRLRADGLTPTAVDVATERGSPLQRTRLAAAALALLTRQLASLVQSGMPLDQALLAVHDQADDMPARKLVDAIRTQVMAGESLPAALSRFPRTFSPLYRGLIGAGTETGRLPEVLTRLADYLDARLALRQ
jgi:general secretion pathway protein F